MREFDLLAEVEVLGGGGVAQQRGERAAVRVVALQTRVAASLRASVPSQAVSTVVCENELMATHAARHTPTESPLPLFRMDVGLYMGLADAGALEGLEVELRKGLLVNKHSHREDPIHRIDVGSYERMVASGVLEGLPIELLEGLLVEVSPQGPEHAAVIRRLTHRLASARGSLGVQLPLETSWGALPEPDLVLTETEPQSACHPRTALLVIEVSVTSHWLDRGKKAMMYASAPVPTYWLVNVPGRAVEVRTEPGPRGYERCDDYRVGDRVPSPAEGVPGLDVAQLFAELGDA